MKIIRNGVCYIEREDIDFVGVLPQNICSVIQWDVYYSIKFKLLKLKDKESVQYFSDKDFILDYDMVKDLSTQELEEMRKEIEDKLEHLSLKWLNASINTREKLDKDKEYNFNIKSLKYYIESINKYINNKEIYDSEISTLSFNNFKKVELKRYSAVSRTEPVSRIPVSSSEMEKLNQSIKSKCKQNASEQAIGRDVAKDFHVGTSAVDVETKQESSFEKSATGEEIRKIMRLKTSSVAFNEQDFIKLLLSKLLKNGISKIDPMKLKYLLADYYSKEKYAFLFEDLALKEQIEGNYVEFDDALVFAHFAGLLSNPIQGTNMRMIWSSLEDVSSNYSTEYNLKMDELVHNLSSRLNIENNSINQSQDSREAISKQDEIEKELYEVRVFNEDDRKNNESCKLEQHKALLYIDDVSEKYSNDMENNVYYECICLECGKHKDYKMSLDDRRHIIKTNLSPMETFMSFYEVRKRYLELIKQNCTVEEIIDNLNSFYKKNQEQGPVLTKKKN